MVENSSPSSLRQKLQTTEEWFGGGKRVHYDPVQKAIVPEKTADSLGVFERVVVHGSSPPQSEDRWLTLLPGFPDGSYGYAKVDALLGKNKNTAPRLYVEYVGQGDSDKPTNYQYSTMERADLVEAQWKAHGVKKTVVVTFDYSSIVVLELLQRQKERQARGEHFPRIEHFLSVNGGLFSDGHSHPITTTPLLKTRLGRMGASMAQKSNFVFDTMLEPLYSREYRTSNKAYWKSEMRETEKAIRLHDGASFMSNAAGFVDEHQRNSTRWNLYNIYIEYCKEEGITVQVVGSKEDPFERRQVELARKRLGEFHPNVKTETIPGGHLSTAEQASLFAEMIGQLAVR